MHRSSHPLCHQEGTDPTHRQHPSLRPAATHRCSAPQCVRTNPVAPRLSLVRTAHGGSHDPHGKKKTPPWLCWPPLLVPLWRTSSGSWNNSVNSEPSHQLHYPRLMKTQRGSRRELESAFRVKAQMCHIHIKYLCVCSQKLEYIILTCFVSLMACIYFPMVMHRNTSFKISITYEFILKSAIGNGVVYCACLTSHLGGGRSGSTHRVLYLQQVATFTATWHF